MAKQDRNRLEFLPEKSLGILFRDIHRTFSKALQNSIAAHGVTIGQWYFFRALWEEDGLTQRELSRRVGMTEPTTVTALNGMEKRGYVKRVRNTTDRRKLNIFLTDLGHSLKPKLLPFVLANNEVAAVGVSAKDIEKVRQVLNHMKNNLEDAGL